MRERTTALAARAVRSPIQCPSIFAARTTPAPAAGRLPPGTAGSARWCPAPAGRATGRATRVAQSRSQRCGPASPGGAAWPSVKGRVSGGDRLMEAEFPPGPPPVLWRSVRSRPSSPPALKGRPSVCKTCRTRVKKERKGSRPTQTVLGPLKGPGLPCRSRLEHPHPSEPASEPPTSRADYQANSWCSEPGRAGAAEGNCDRKGGSRRRATLGTETPLGPRLRAAAPQLQHDNSLLVPMWAPCGPSGAWRSRPGQLLRARRQLGALQS